MGKLCADSSGVQAAAERLDLLLGWAREVCAKSGADVPLYDLAGSFADGRALCHIVRTEPAPCSTFHSISARQDIQ